MKMISLERMDKNILIMYQDYSKLTFDSVKLEKDSLITSAKFVHQTHTHLRKTRRNVNSVWIMLHVLGVTKSQLMMDTGDKTWPLIPSINVYCHELAKVVSLPTISIQSSVRMATQASYAIAVMRWMVTSTWDKDLMDVPSVQVQFQMRSESSVYCWQCWYG